MPAQRDDLPERCDLAREGNSERRACSRLKARCAFNASEVCLRLDWRRQGRVVWLGFRNWVVFCVR
ncbi:hypothetical protein GVAMD_0044 [Gardnerella vaginalis AMD]|nr:hypothetical protein GVAMD_0044 [Gardnerella vaginalis AMD]